MSEQQPCGGCEKLREALERISKSTRWNPLVEGGRSPSWDALTAIEALAQPCQQPASVGSEEWEIVDHGESIGMVLQRGDRELVVLDTNLTYTKAKELKDVHNAALRRRSATRKEGDAPCPSAFKDSPGSSGKPTSSTPAAADVCQGCGEYYYECSCQSAPVEAWRDGATYTEDELRQRVKLMCNTNLHFSEQYGMLFILNDDNQILLNIGRLQRRVTQGEQ